jgi:hypothetical protein
MKNVLKIGWSNEVKDFILSTLTAMTQTCNYS